MKRELTQYVESIISSLTLKHHVKEDAVEQIASYHGVIKLYELFESATVAVHYSNSTAHIILVDKSIAEIKEDVTDIIPEDPKAKKIIAKRAIVPIVIFSIKIGPGGYVAMKPGVMDNIYLSVVPSKKKDNYVEQRPSPVGMSKDLFDIFSTLQNLVYKP